MNSLATRLIVAALIILGGYYGGKAVQASIKPPQVKQPAWKPRDLPLELGQWKGTVIEPDKRVVIATGAEAVADRSYRDDYGHSVVLHFATFNDPAEAVYHNPMNCYRAAGWQLKEESEEAFPLEGQEELPVRLAVWQREGERVMVAHWYQLGDLFLYTRIDLLKARWKMRGQETWPPTIKVMLQIAVDDPEQAKSQLADLAAKIHKWLRADGKTAPAKSLQPAQPSARLNYPDQSGASGAKREVP